MPTIVFYSWQSDLPSNVNNELIYHALEQAALAIGSPESIVIDRDTLGVPGSPDILQTILEKIRRAKVFVCDLSFVAENPRRKLPNPNVLVEFGYAMYALGMENVIMVFNEAYGRVGELPFDVGRFRVLTYNLSENAEDITTEQTQLQQKLERQLREILVTAPTVSSSGTTLAARAIRALEDNAPDSTSHVRRFMTWVAKEIKDRNPTLTPETTTGLYFDLKEAIDSTEYLVIEFARVAQAVASMGHFEAAATIYRDFSPILEGYNVPRGFSGSYLTFQFDFYRFIGHELFVTLFALLIREERWAMIGDLLKRGILIDNTPPGTSDLVSYTYASRPVVILNSTQSTQGEEPLFDHAELLANRHRKPAIADIVPIDLFVEADYLLFLSAEIRSDNPHCNVEWCPCSVRFLGSRTPRYLIEAYNQDFAQELVRALNVANIDVLRSFPIERYRCAWAIYGGLAQYDTDALRDFRPARIATE